MLDRCQSNTPPYRDVSPPSVSSMKAEPANASALDGALRNLVGGMPVILVAHEGHGEPVARVALRVARHDVVLVETVRAVPGAVIFLVFERGQQVARSDRPATPRPEIGCSRRTHR